MLIVEDQDYMRRALRAFLQSAFPERNIFEAADGKSALTLCRERHPQLVLMDISLPDANGIELTAQIKALLPEAKIIIVSSHSGSAFSERAQQAGAFAYVPKDELHRSLLPAVHRALGQPTRPADPRQ